jgi:DNA topoisomerase-1
MKMIVEREDEIKAFQPVEYWSFGARLSADVPPPFVAKLTKVDGKKAEVPNEETARKIEAALKSGKYVVADVARKERKQSAAPPFITSSGR